MPTPTRDLGCHYRNILSAFVTQLTTGAGLDGSQVGVSLTEDAGDYVPSGDKFAMVAPGRLPIDQGMVGGGGSTLYLFRGTVRVFLWSRNHLDSEFTDATHLLSSDGVLAFTDTVLAAFCSPMFDPVDVATGNHYLLAEPARLVTPNIRPRRIQPGWVRVSLEFSTIFRQAF